MQNIRPEKQRSALIQFYDDLRIDGCILQIGTLTSVELLPKDSTEALSYIESHPTENLYFLSGVDANREMQRSRDEDIRFKSNFFFDFDVRIASPDITDEEIKELGFWLGEQLSKTPLFCQWKYVVFSGNGIHVHYCGDPVAINSIEHWKIGIQEFITSAESRTKTVIDKKCGNVARICRAPGSYNNKNGHRMVEILLMQPEAKMDIGHIEKLGRERQKETGSKYQEAEKIEGDIIEGERHQTLTSLAGSLRWRGLDAETMFVALSEVNRTRFKPPLDEKEVRSIAEDIGKKAAGKLQAKQDDTDSWALTVKKLSDYQQEDVQWLWTDRIAMGYLTLIEGDPDMGKSTLTQFIASEVTRGHTFPGEDANKKNEPGKVLMLASEEGIPQIVLPKMKNMGANIENIHIIESVKHTDGNERMFSLAADTDKLDRCLEQESYKLLIVDPLNSYMGAKMDMNSEADVRAVLTPFLKLAQKYSIAVICIRHFGKGQKDRMMHKGLGSTAYTAIARAAYGIIANPLNYSERLMLKLKNNLSRADIPAIAFEITGFGIVEWRGERTITEDMLNNSSKESGEKDVSALNEAKDFLRSILAEAPLLAKDVLKAARSEGIKERTLRRAREEICMTPTRDDQGRSLWALAHNELIDWTSWPSANEGLLEAKNEDMANMVNANEEVSLDEPNDGTETI